MKRNYLLLLIIFNMILLYSCESKINYCESNMYLCYILSLDTNDPLDENNIYEVIKTDDLREKMENKETFYLYYGSPECGICLNNVQNFNRNAQANNISVLYYLDYSRANDRIMEEILAVSSVKTPEIIYFADGLFVDMMSNYTEEFETMKDLSNHFFELHEKTVTEE